MGADYSRKILEMGCDRAQQRNLYIDKWGYGYRSRGEELTDAEMPQLGLVQPIALVGDWRDVDQ